MQEVIANTKMTTIVGDIDWKNSPVKNVAKLKIAGGQWRLQPDGSYALKVTYNKAAPEVPIEAKFKLGVGG